MCSQNCANYPKLRSIDDNLFTYGLLLRNASQMNHIFCDYLFYSFALIAPNIRGTEDYERREISETMQNEDEG